MCAVAKQGLLRRGARRRRAGLLACAAAFGSAGAGAQDDETPLGIVAGAVMRLSPQYSGAGQLDTSLRPLLAIRYGRFRLASSGASAVLSFGGETVLPGASADIVATDDVRIGVALRIDEGRSASDSPLLEGLPEVRRTLRGRFYGSIDLTPHWSASLNVSQDLLGRQGGALASLDTGYRDRWSQSTQWSISAGVAAGNRRYMRTAYGIGEQSAAATGLSAYAPGSGLRDVHAGAGLITAFTPRWIGYTNLGSSRLLGPAAHSPLTLDRSSYSLSIGLGYRWNR